MLPDLCAGAPVNRLLRQAKERRDNSSHPSNHDAQAGIGIPETWDSRSPLFTGGFNLISPPKNQGSCGSCVAFATIAAAEAAVATQMRMNNNLDFSAWLCSLLSRSLQTSIVFCLQGKPNKTK
jgi:C1A family cysteine protease